MVPLLSCKPPAHTVYALADAPTIHKHDDMHNAPTAYRSGMRRCTAARECLLAAFKPAIE